MADHRRPRARLYHQLRTAHLERAAQLPPATILFGDRRYDFDEQLAGTLDLVQARGWRSAWWLLRHPVQTLEINEPLMLPAVRSTAVALAGLRLGRLLGHPRTAVVSYAIENLDPHEVPVRADRAHARLLRKLDLALARAVGRRVDRIVFGTASAQQLYARRLPARNGQHQKLIWALPAPAGQPVPKEANQVLFLGAFNERKGFPLLTRAWQRVRAACPAARLTLVGKGALRDTAEQLAAADPSVRLLVDPPREAIRAELSRAQVLVLPSQPSTTWREQVGLPIVEGLAYGCTIVTTDATGLAAWLTEHGHRVLPAAVDEMQLAEAIVAALRRPVPAVRDSLPEQDGRLAADEWMFG